MNAAHSGAGTVIARRILVLTVVLAALLALFAAVGGSIAGAEARGRRAASSQAIVARRLATRVARARTPKQREAAVLAVMRALRIGVYSSAGKAIVSGGERGPRSFYLYRFEVASVAAALGRKERFSPDQVAAQLAAAGVAPNGSPVTGQRVADAVALGTRRYMKRPRDGFALAPLLVRELGLRQRPRVDTRTPLPAAEARLDALQRALILADVAVGAQARQARRARSATPMARAAQQPGPSQGQRDKAGVCAFLGADGTGSKRWQIGKWIFDKVVGATPVEKLVTPLTNLWHSAFLGLLMDVQPTRGGQVTSTHYGRGGAHPGFTEPHYPGQELVFQIGVQLVGDIPEADVRCGKLVGLEFPNNGRRGPVANVPIDWDPVLSAGDYDELTRHGTVVRKDERTGANGIAVLRFRPKDEVIAGVGRRVTEIGVLQPGADVVGAFGNDIARAWELVAPRFATIAWSVELHKPKGFRFRSTTDRICFTLGACDEYSFRTQWVYEAGMCGIDPYRVPWTGTIRRSQISGGEEETGEDPFEFVPLGSGQPAVWYPSWAIGDNDNRVEFTLVEGPPAVMKVDAYYSNNFSKGSEAYRTYEDHKQVAIEENPNCPEVP